MNRLLFIVTVLGVASACLHADVVHLNDGGRLEGTIRRTADGWEVVEADGKVHFLKESDVKGFERTTAASREQVAAGQLAALRVSADRMADVDRIIAAFESFIRDHADTPAADSARAELARWREREREGLVRFGGRWVTAEEQMALLRQVMLNVDEARTLIRQNRIKDAEEAVKRALAADPTSAAALYLRGLLLFRAGDLTRAVIPGLKPDRIPVIPGGLAIMSAVFKEFGLERMTFSEGALRLGVLYDLLGRVQHHDMREMTVRQFVRRYHVDAAQGERVRALAASTRGVQLSGAGRSRWSAAA